MQTHNVLIKNIKKNINSTIFSYIWFFGILMFFLVSTALVLLPFYFLATRSSQLYTMIALIGLSFLILLFLFFKTKKKLQQFISFKVFFLYLIKKYILVPVSVIIFLLLLLFIIRYYFINLFLGILFSILWIILLIIGTTLIRFFNAYFNKKYIQQY